MAFVRYTVLRVLVFAVVAALLWVVGFRGFWLVLIAIFLSGVASVFLLTKSRDAASAALSGRVGEIKRRMAERTAAEDAWDDSWRRSHRGSNDDEAGLPGTGSPGSEDNTG